VGDEDGEFADVKSLTDHNHIEVHYKLKFLTNSVIKGDRIEYGLSRSRHGERRKRLSNCG